METGIDYFDLAIKIFAISGLSAMVSSFLTNARGKNRFIDFLFDIVEAVGWNFNKSENKPDA